MHKSEISRRFTYNLDGVEGRTKITPIGCRYDYPSLRYRSHMTLFCTSLVFGDCSKI